MKTSGTDGRLFFSETLDYLGSYLPKQAGRSEKTVKAYRDALSVFRRYLYDERGISITGFRFADCTKTLLLEFIAYLRERGNAPSTCNQRLSAIKSYVWFAADKDISLQSVALNVSRTPQVKAPERPKDTLDAQALSTLFNTPANTRVGLRDRTILIVLYDSAIRMDELLSLTVAETNLTDKSNPYLRIHGKGNKERIVAITTRTAEHIEKCVREYHDGIHNSSDYLFYTVIKGTRHKMSPSNVERLIKKYSDLARRECESMPDNVHAHMFRRTRATELYQNGVSLELIARMLGHSEIETSRVYAKPSIEMLRKALESVEGPELADEKPLWGGSEEELAKLYGLR